MSSLKTEIIFDLLNLVCEDKYLRWYKNFDKAGFKYYILYRGQIVLSFIYTLTDKYCVLENGWEFITKSEDVIDFLLDLYLHIYID